MEGLAWLSLADADGREYWAAMSLMGRYAAANHALIHRYIGRKLGTDVILDIENHHNFAWKETHEAGGKEREVIVHRKGATPAGAGVLAALPLGSRLNKQQSLVQQRFQGASETAAIFIITVERATRRGESLGILTPGTDHRVDKALKQHRNTE